MLVFLLICCIGGLIIVSSIALDLRNKRDKLIIELGEKHEYQKYTELIDAQIDKLRELHSQEEIAQKKIEKIIEPVELNFYAKRYDFEKSIEYERTLNENTKAQRSLIKDDKAIVNTYIGTTDPRVVKLLGKLSLRSFNSECDLLVFKVDYKNIVAFENRITTAFEQLNKLTEKYGIILSNELLNLKIQELQIVHEFQEKKQDEAEEQRQIREIMRDELKAERELEKAKAEAEKEEQKYQMLLDKAIANAQKSTGTELDNLNAQIAILQQQLEDAKAKERAISQAQQTKAGYVYVVSNIGSFGEGVYKIGMTRRLEPQERINELGGASVPFAFDVHAMIYGENAPELENTLHRHFEANRVNKVNGRKEFFRVNLDEIERIVLQYNQKIKFTKLAEAKEYRMTISMEKEAIGMW